MQYLSGGKKLQLSRDIVQQFLLYSALGLSSHAIVNIEWRLFQVMGDATPSSSFGNQKYSVCCIFIFTNDVGFAGLFIFVFLNILIKNIGIVPEILQNQRAKT